VRMAAGVKFAGHTEALRVNIEQSNEPRMSARRDSGAVVRVERCRHWSDEEKLAILKETTQPGAIMAVVARRYGIGTGQLYTWRKQLLRGAVIPTFDDDSRISLYHHNQFCCRHIFPRLRFLALTIG